MYLLVVVPAALAQVSVLVLAHVLVVLVSVLVLVAHAPVVLAHVLVVQVDQALLLHIVQAETLVAVHQVVKVDLIVLVNVQVLVVAAILRVHLVKVDQRRAMPRRVRKLCVMISKTCKRLHLAA